MRTNSILGVAIAMIFGLLLLIQPTKAQIYGEFGTVVVIKDTGYVQLTGAVSIPGNDFKLPPKPYLQIDRDDGYKLVQLGFTFEFNNEIYDEVWICVNGFLTFSEPPLVRSDVQQGLFLFGENYPINVIAPYWGDHYFRTFNDNVGRPSNFQYKPSEILYKTETIQAVNSKGETVPQRVFTVEWRNLNINDETKTQSVGNFQVKLYESLENFTRQGDIEFCYGLVAGNENTYETEVETRFATIGLKGETQIRITNGIPYADYVNGLYYAREWVEDDFLFYNGDSVRTTRRVTNNWQPSGGSDYRIILGVNPRFSAIAWGDGDTDISQAEGKKHSGMDQNRFVTPNDVRTIIRSIVTNVPLDSIRFRNGYHADVNHNGRYYYDNDGIRRDLPWRNVFEGDSLDYIVNEQGNIVPSGISSLRRVFYRATEYDAAMILAYMGAKLPSLPWLLDTIVDYGKLNADIEFANNIRFGTASRINDNTYRIPVYLNGYYDGSVATRFDLTKNILNVESMSSIDNKVEVAFNSNRVVIAANGEFSEEMPLCYITIESDDSEITASNIKFNDNSLANIDVAIEENESNNQNVTVGPNPFFSVAKIQVNTNTSGNYTLSIYDNQGNLVNHLYSGNLDGNSTSTFLWNGEDMNGTRVAEGLYIYRLVNGNETVSGKIILKR